MTITEGATEIQPTTIARARAVVSMPGPAAGWDAVSDDYDTWIISPFARDVCFPLRGDLRRLLVKWKTRGSLQQRVALDLGCGRGDGVALLAGRVGFTVGVDFSPRMLDLSERFLRARGVTASRYRGRGGLRRIQTELRDFDARRERASRTVLVEGDLSALQPLRCSADLVLAISSISPHRPGLEVRAFAEVVSCLKPGGTLMAVFASWDAFDYLLALASRRGVELPDVGHVDAHGMFHENGEQQKFFTPSEIRQLCAANSLRVLTLEKVRYPWRFVRRFGLGYFPGCPRLWDWYLVARTRL
jgi:SAM-dependent methyltransferase